MAQINVINSVFMGGITASSAADCASDSKILIPQMEKRGYPRSFACANTASSAVLANLIPPSMGLILYGALASVSVGALFVADYYPGAPGCGRSDAHGILGFGSQRVRQR